MKSVRALISSLLLACPALCAFEADPWWDVAWTARRFLDVRPTGAGVLGAETGVAEFPGMGRIAPGGQDLRVVADGQPLPLKVVYAGEADQCVVAFKMPRGAKRFFVYFGNPKAPKLSVAWEPERGLWLEVRRYNGGQCENWEQMKKLVEKSGPALGGGPVRQVFQGHNPFSNEARYVSIYRGWLTCPADGAYVFATTSKDASFLFLDGKLVTGAPGWHWADPRARHTATVTLSRGVRPFAYYHVCNGPEGMAAAYWQPPAAERLAPIPAEAFTPVAPARAGPLEVRGATALDIEAVLDAEAYVGERPLLRYRFRLVGAPAALRDVTWDCGDGVSIGAAGPEVRHVYFREGVFRIAVRGLIQGKAVEAAASVGIHIDYNKQTQAQKDDPAALLADARGYRWETMDTASLESAAAFFFLRDDADGQIGVARALVARPQLSAALYFEQAMRLQALLREKRQDPDGALAVLRAAEERVKTDKNMRAKILREIGDVYYFHKRDLDHALLEYDKVVGRYTGLEDNIVRVTKIRIGDIMRERGNTEKAALNYSEADKLRLDKWTPEQAPVRIGVLIHAAEDFLRRGDAAEARKWVEIWEWEFPLERLRGQSSILRAKIALLDNNIAEAKQQLEGLVRVNPDSQYVGEALFMLADLALREKDVAKARALLKELVEKHPDSERAPDAEAKLKKLDAGAGIPSEVTPAKPTPPAKSTLRPLPRKNER